MVEEKTSKRNPAYARKFRKEAKKYDSEYAQQAMRMVASGATLTDVAYWLGTSKSNVQKWKKENPEFKKALNRGAELTQAWLLAKGIRAAAGYDYMDRELKYEIDKDGNKTGKVTVWETYKHQPANPQLVIFLTGALGRRLGDESWTTKQFTESKIEKNINYRIVDGQKIVDHMDKLAGKWAIPLENVTVREAEFESPRISERSGDTSEIIPVDSEKPC